jgi:hypothetical protein
MPKKVSRSTYRKNKGKKGKKSKKNKCKKGGSLASNAVMESVNVNAPGVDGYKTMMHLPSQDKLMGGSLASNRLESFMKDGSNKPRSELLQKSEFDMEGNLGSGFKTETYSLTGGAKGDMKKNLVTLINVARNNPNMNAEKLVKNFHKCRPMAKRITEKELKEGPKDELNKMKKSQKGGNGFLSVAGCGPVNAPNAGRKYASYFTKTSSCPGPEFYQNPDNLGAAGSGMADLGVGAPKL